MKGAPSSFGMFVGIVGIVVMTTAIGCKRGGRKNDASERPASCGAWAKAVGSRCEDLRFHLLTPPEGVGEGTVGMHTLIVDGEGRFVAAWEGGETGQKPVLAIAEETAAGVAYRVASRALPPAMNFGPALGAGPGKNVFVAWQHQIPTAACIVASERGADGTWTDPTSTDQALSLPDVWTGNPRVQCVPSGRCLMVWTQAGTPDQKFFALGVSERSAFGAPWTKPKDRTDVISPKIFFVDDNDLALAPTGEALVTWYQAGSDKPGGGGVLAVYKSERKNPGDPFPRMERNDTISPRNRDVSGNRGGKSVLPLVGPEGRAAIIWSQENSTTVAGDTRTIMVSVRKPDGTWDIPSSIDEGLVEKGLDAFWVQGAFKSDGSLVVVWQEGNSSPARRVRAAVLPPSSRKPTGPLLTLSSEGLEAMAPSLAYSPKRGFVVGWLERRGTGPFRVILRRWADGEKEFGRAMPLSPPDDLQTEWPRVAIGGPMERVVVTWKRGDSAHQKMVAGAFD